MYLVSVNTTSAHPRTARLADRSQSTTEPWKSPLHRAPKWMAPLLTMLLAMCLLAAGPSQAAVSLCLERRMGLKSMIQKSHQSGGVYDDVGWHG